MKLPLSFFVVLWIGFAGFAQSIDYNTKKGYVANGYDVVSYFDGTAVQGKKQHTATHDGVKYKFATAENLKTFKAEPEKYVPLYGGYCAYAVATKSDKVSIDPETFEIRDGRLLLFYNAWGTNTLELWEQDSPEKLKAKADQNWEKIKND
ncbi:YHS domain-containing (seleno)protein [Flagellimonas sp. DF-77]|uniref:YHS domain-containing (seleno)protein n=1 Tax=Flagellimonas algarum TaxID=3230298 RepID=UPI003394D9EF